MRVYEFAKSIGADSSAVMKMAEAHEIEVYSALTVLEDADLKMLRDCFLKEGAQKIRATREAIEKKKRAKYEELRRAQQAHREEEATRLEAIRQRAQAVHEGKKPVTPLSSVKIAPPPEPPPEVVTPRVTPKPVVKKVAPAVKIQVSPQVVESETPPPVEVPPPQEAEPQQDVAPKQEATSKKVSSKKNTSEKKVSEEPTVEIGLNLPEMPKVSFEVSETDEASEEDDSFHAPESDFDEDEDDDLDARDYLHGKDRAEKLTSKSAAAKKENAALKKEGGALKKEKDAQDRREVQERKEGLARKDNASRKEKDASITSTSATHPATSKDRTPDRLSSRTSAPSQKMGDRTAPQRPGQGASTAARRPQPPRVGGLRAGFSSVSMNVSRPRVLPSTPQIQATTPAHASAPVVPPKPTISMQVSTREISIRGAVLVKELALKLGIRPNRLIADLMGLKVLASINQRVEPDVATKVAQKYGYKVNVERARDATNKKPVLKSIDADDEIPQDQSEQMRPRPPVVTFLGHVDHGKTTLMDYIRHAHVAAGEAGGITQQISAYQVDVQGRKITFLDTPGHAAFNAMRQRGAQLTDIAVIIIAADDGIMPQTEEAIKFARQAGVQIMVAITKCDKETANTQRVKQQLQKAGLTPEEWGGDIVCCEVSGTTGKGVDTLLEMMLLQADVLELSANPSRRANGYVIEAELEQGFGPSATLLVTGGTLKVGDAILIGEHFGKVRSLIDDRGRRIKEATPAMPVKCTGISGVPEAGAEFRVMLNEKRARDLAEETKRLRKEQELAQTKAVSLDDLMTQMSESGKRELNVVVKSDTQGSLEAIVEALNGIKSQKVNLKVIDTGTGNVSLNDVKSAAAGHAVIVGFDVGCDSGVQQQARHDAVRINSFRIIYELIDHIKKSMLDLLPPEFAEKIKGHAEIKTIYDIGKTGKIAGSQMLDGTLVSSARYRILRNKTKVWEGKVQTLRHFKDEVKEVTGQQECGICFANFEAFAEGDVVECYILEELPRSL